MTLTPALTPAMRAAVDELVVAAPPLTPEQDPRVMQGRLKPAQVALSHPR